VTATKIEIHARVPTERFLQLMDKATLPIEYGGANELDYPQTLLADTGAAEAPSALAAASVGGDEGALAPAS